MSGKPKDGRSRRPYGTGHIFTKGRTWYGQWLVNGTPVKRSLGPVRSSDNREGLSQRQAEGRLRDLMSEVKAPPPGGRLSLEDAGRRHIAKLRMLGRKKSTLEDYEGYLRNHLVPAFGDPDVSKIKKADIEKFIAIKMRQNQSPKSVRNYLGLLHGVLEYCVKQEVIKTNPAKLVDKPRTIDRDPGLKFLNLGELDRLIEACPDDDLGKMERVLYLTCAMTGLRQSEALGLRWSNVDWVAQRIRVQEGFVRGEFGSPKSSYSRSVPMAERVARQLELLSRDSEFSGDGDLVFCNPTTGKPYDRSKLYKRFRSSRDRAGVTKITFHGLRHTFGTRMAAAGVPMRTLQEWGGWKDFQTVLIYAHYAPGDQDADLVAKAFGGDSPATIEEELETVSGGA